ncbi:ATP-binding protein [Anaerostipes sp.]|uniref:ATP-binding protein n=1 Tax=Anaerostipes sp. TaxID=1872530 RepID=UPI0025C20FE2|nr:ATP-binding protein [Anaerostipes sp.]MBS7008983.1 putative DNA binding domain-containing protein [Anaerostipes sp.]
MTFEELEEKLNTVQQMKCETQFLELKSASKGCPKRLFDTLSSFSNQDDGGILIFGIDEEQDYKEVGVYDAQDLQKKINAQCLQMEPIVRPLLTVLEKNGKNFVSAEIPGIDIVDRPCYYKGTGRIKGSYVRVGDSDEPMTEYEIYSYEAYRKKYQDDIREVRRATFAAMDQAGLDHYIELLREGKPNLSNLPKEELYELMSITRNNIFTLSSVLLFNPYPQAYFPQLCIIAVVVPGNEIGETGLLGERFLDNQRIEGNIKEMLEQSLQFVRKNMRNKTIINPDTGKRTDQTDYPLTAVREAVLNALVHRDYSINTEGMPIQIFMYEDRMEIRNPGGIYGRIKINQLGKIQPDTRNPVLASAMEVLGITENRYSGIPAMRKAMKEYHLQEPEFTDERGNFVVKFYKQKSTLPEQDKDLTQETKNLLIFCRTPRTRKEISEYLGLTSVTYAIQKHINPLIKRGLIHLSIPEKPSSPKQLYYSNEKFHE